MTAAQQQREHTLEVINRLYAAERKSLLPRLAELGAFVEWACAHEMQQVRRMIAEQARHADWLIQAADCCDGVLFPAGADVGTASLHYLDLRMLLPRVIDSVEKLAQAYARALQDDADLQSEAAEILTSVQARHQSHLEQLRAIQSRLQRGDSC